MQEDADTGAPEASKPFLDLIKDGEKALSTYQEKCDSIDAKYASLKTMAEALGDREFQIFWANLEVLKPSIYTRSPQPVVQPRHRDGQEVQRKASEMLERVLEMDIEADDLHDTLLMVRDDLATSARGVPWVLDNGECLHVDRRDFVHDPARKWKECGWVARRAYMTREAIADRFPDADRTKIKFEEVKKDDADDYKTSRKKASVWEIWHKGRQAVIWVTPDYPEVLEVSDPLVNVKGFFPCPKPAYGTLERGTLKPVPDFVYYRDQVDEINELTARISSLSESLRLKGFYASGTSEVGEAIEAAMKQTDNKAILVPVSSTAALGGGKLSDAIVWLPVDEVAQVITALVQLRKQLIEDVYEITGLSDIMRGATEASETATAQNLKAQYGSVRIRERQNEMVRVARDVIRLKAEIFAEKVPGAELAVMAGMSFPSQMQPVEGEKTVFIEQIDQLLKNERLRPFVLEVESDSTIAPNEEAEKQSRIEFITAMGAFIQQAGAMVAQQPETAPFAAELMKFTAGGFRAGRELGQAIDEFAELVKQKAAEATQNQGPTPQQQEMNQMLQERFAELQEFEKRLDKQARDQNVQLHDAKVTEIQERTNKTLAEIAKIQAEPVQVQ